MCSSVSLFLCQTFYGQLSDLSQELFKEKDRTRRRKDFLCIYAQLCVLDRELRLERGAAKRVQMKQPIVISRRRSTCSGTSASSLPALCDDSVV